MVAGGVNSPALLSDVRATGALFGAFAISSSVATFFNAAVVHCASQVFDGEERTGSDRRSN
jgi:hypothetical protein